MTFPPVGFVEFKFGICLRYYMETEAAALVPLYFINLGTV